MKYRIKLYRGEVFATPHIYFPPMLNPIGLIFYYNDKSYKILDALYPSNEEENTSLCPLAELTVVEIPTI